MSDATYHSEQIALAISSIQTKDKKLAQAIAHIGYTDAEVTKVMGTPIANYHYLAQTVINQQLSTKAAATIFARMQKLLGGKTITTQKILTFTPEELRTCGVSRNKAGYLHKIAKIVSSNKKYFSLLKQLNSEDAIAELKQLPGFGDWSARVFAMFHLGKYDIFPYGDAGLERGIMLLYGFNPKQEQKKLDDLIKKWRPWQTIACIIIWRRLHFFRDGFK